MSAPAQVPVHTRVLDNGLRVVVSESRLAPIVAVEVWYDVGSRHEEPGRTGFAHLFEHLMFQGSGNVASGEHFALIQAQGGSLNGTTSFDRTNYFQTLPVHAYELGLWLEADRMATLLDAVNQDNLDNQRDVVKNERRQRYDNQPYGTAWEHLFAAVYPEGHPYHHLPIGSMADLDAASLEDVHGFFHRHYGPDNAVLAIVGDVEPEAAFAAAERHFGAIPAIGSLADAPDGAIGQLDAPVTTVLTEDVPSQARYLVYRTPPDGTPEADALEVATEVLAGGGASRLVQGYVRGKQLAQSVSAGLQGLVGGTNVAAVVAHARSGADLDALADGIDEEVDRLVTFGPTDEELARAKARLERDALQHVETVASRADLLCRYEALHGGAAGVNAILDRIHAVTADDIRDAGRAWLAPDNRAVLEYREGGSR